MKSIDLTQLEEKLNEIKMDDTFMGYRPAHAVAQMYFGRNDISNEQLNQVEAALDELVRIEELDRSTQNKVKVYRSQKFGSKREEYLSVLAKRAEEAQRLREAAEQFEELIADEGTPFFERDYAWFVESA